MVAPLVIPAIMLISSLATAIWDIYSTSEVKSAYQDQYDYTNTFYSGALAENSQFWSDYIRKHHLQDRDIKYPYRSGYNFDSSKLYSSAAGSVSNDFAVGSALMHGINRSAQSAGIYSATRNKYGMKKHR